VRDDGEGAPARDLGLKFRGGHDGLRGVGAQGPRGARIGHEAPAAAQRAFAEGGRGGGDLSGKENIAPNGQVHDEMLAGRAKFGASGSDHDETREQSTCAVESVPLASTKVHGHPAQL
jgi:hypothetical protein